MRIIPSKEEAAKPIDIKALYLKFANEYSTVFMEDYGDDGVFIFHSLGRKDYRLLVNDELTSLCDKEEIICESCVCWPENYDFENCENAGLPSKLAQSILEKSLLDKPDSLQNAIHAFRSQINNSIHDQISCAIHEAFPEFEIEEIDNWDIAKTAEYMAKAEFILHNLRGVPMAPVQEEKMYAQEPPPVSRKKPQDKTEEKKNVVKTQEIENHSTNQKPRLTPEKLAELQQKFPEIDWAHDNGFQGIEGFKKRNRNFDTRRPGERPMDGSEDGQNAIPLALRDRFKVIGPVSDVTEDTKKE